MTELSEHYSGFKFQTGNRIHNEYISSVGLILHF